MSEKDISWMLDEDPEGLTLLATGPDRVLVTGNDGRRCELSFVNGRLLFDGEDIETEDFMVYLGILDEGQGNG